MSTSSLDSHALAAQVLVALARAAQKGRNITAADLAETLQVRRPDVRDVISRLHAEGHVDALRMRLSLSGLALAKAFSACKAKPVRREAPAVVTSRAA